MKKYGKKLLTIGLLAAVLCTGTISAKAETVNRTIGNHSLCAETSISRTGGMARTVSSSYDVQTTVYATYYYVDVDNHTFYSKSNSDSGVYGSSVTFSVPSGNYESFDISAGHSAQCGTESWSISTYEKY